MLLLFPLFVLFSLLLLIVCPCVSLSGLNKWVEIGNSGVFRPEMLLPMGLPEDVAVIAWGLSLERSVHGLCTAVQTACCPAT